jgi:hypothetical protein
MWRTYIWAWHKWAQLILLVCKTNEIYCAIFQRRTSIAWPFIRDIIVCLSITVSERYTVYWFSVAFCRRIFSGLLRLQVLDSFASSLCSPNKLKKIKQLNLSSFCIFNLLCLLIFICIHFIGANTTLWTQRIYLPFTTCFGHRKVNYNNIT